MSTAVSSVCASARPAPGSSVSPSATSVSESSALMGSGPLQAQQLEDLDRLASALDHDASASANHHPVLQDCQRGAADQDAGAEVAVEPLHARRQVHGIAEHRVLLLSRRAEGAREGVAGGDRDAPGERAAPAHLPAPVQALSL